MIHFQRLHFLNPADLPAVTRKPDASQWGTHLGGFKPDRPEQLKYKNRHGHLNPDRFIISELNCYKQKNQFVLILQLEGVSPSLMLRLSDKGEYESIALVDASGKTVEAFDDFHGLALTPAEIEKMVRIMQKAGFDPDENFLSSFKMN